MEQYNSLHPLVALAPLCGVLVMVLGHITLTRLCAGLMGYLPSVVMSAIFAEIASLAVAIWGTQHMRFLPLDSPLPLWVMVAISTGALCYGYFTFYNLNLTSLRIRIIRQLWSSEKHSMHTCSLAHEYNGDVIAHARLNRLRAWKQVVVNGDGRYCVRPGLFLFLSHAVREARKLILPNHDSRLSSLRKKMHVPANGRNILRGLVYAVLSLTVLYFIVSGIEIGLHHSATERTRYHGLPVAISQVFFNQPHDYTAIKSVALPFQSSAPYNSLIKAAKSASRDSSVGKDQTYYWLADDRGFSDLINISIRMFGARIEGLYFAFCGIIVISILLSLMIFYRDTFALSCLSLYVLAYASFLPALGAVTKNSVVATNFSVNISETRTFEMLALLYFLQIVLLIIRKTPLSKTAIGCLAIQAIIVGFLYSCRSSIGWVVVCVAVLCGGASLRFLLSSLKNNRYAMRRLLWSAFGIVFLLAGVFTFKGWHALAENPYYLEQGGARTFFHNALMGLAGSTVIEKYGITGVDDRLAIRATNRWLAEQDRADYDENQLLNALGGHATADWLSYEESAKDFYFYLWRKHSFQLMQTYGKKFIGSCIQLWTIQGAVYVPRTSDQGLQLNGRRYNPNPFRFDYLALAIIPIIVLSFSIKIIPKLIGALGVSLLFSLIPSVSFYTAVCTLSGASLILRLALYITAIYLPLRLYHQIMALRRLTNAELECSRVVHLLIPIALTIIMIGLFGALAFPTETLFHK